MKDGTFTADRLLALYDRVAEAEDAIPRLRRFVLDLAVRGKLVEQDPTDEPAAELLKRIAKEKARLVKAGVIRKPKPFDLIDEPPFTVPRNWAWSRMREVTTDRGQMIPNARFTYIDVSAINKEAGVIEAPTVLEPAEAPSRARKIVRKGDVIYSCVRPYLLNVAVVEDEIEPAPIASTAFAIINGLGLILPRFIWIVLRSPFMVTAVEETQRGQAYPAINDADFAVLPFPLPPLAEQRRIVAKVDELMALCDRLEAARTGREAVRDRLTAATLTRLTAPETDARDFPTHARFALQTLPTLTTRPDQIKTLRQAILNLAVRGKLVEQDPTDEPAQELLKRAVAAKQKIRAERRIGRTEDPEFSTSAGEEIAPQNWVWANLADFALVLGGKRLPAGADFSAEPTDHIYIRVTDMKDGTILSDKLKFISSEVQAQIAKYTIDSEDIYITIAGTIGEVGDVPGAFHGHNLTENAAKIVFREVSKDFLLLVLKSQDVQDQFTEKTKQMAQPKLALKRILGARLPLPPFPEQHRIVAKVDALMALCDQLEASLTTATTTRSRLFEALLHEALGGALGGEAEAAA